MYNRIPKIDQSFKTFISSLLKRANISDKTLTSLLDNEAMILFRKAFTHKSYDSKFNYEYLEHRGDVIVNLVSVQYTKSRFPDIISVQWLKTIKDNLSSKKMLPYLAIRAGFENRILYGQEIKNYRDNRDNVKYQSMLEDVFEAFFGALAIVFRRKKPLGVEYAVSYQIIKSLFDEKKISLKFEDVFDVVSRIKLVYDANGWEYGKSTQSTFYNRRENLYITTMYGFVNPEDPSEKKLISKGINSNRDLSVEDACEKGLEMLRNYNIHEKIPSMYEKQVSDRFPDILPKPFDIPQGFKEYMSEIFRKANVNERDINLFTKEEYLFDFRLSFVHDSYNVNYNYGSYKLEGETVLNLSIVDYISKKFPGIESENWLSNIKQSILGNKSKKGGLFAQIAADNIAEDYILYGTYINESLEKKSYNKNDEKYKKMVSDVFKALLGAIVNIIDGIKCKGVGYAVAYRFFENNIKEKNISIDYKEVFNAKGRLKELYDSKQWFFSKENFISTVNENETNKHTITVIGYPLNDRTKKEENKVVLAIESGELKKPTEQKAAKKALEVLEKYYNIKEKSLVPYNK